MKLTTLLKINDVLEEDGYKTVIEVVSYKNFSFVKLIFHKGKYHETLFSASYKKTYVLQKLNGRMFENKEIRESI